MMEALKFLGSISSINEPMEFISFNPATGE